MLLAALDEATAGGVPLTRCCSAIGLTERTVQRWRAVGGGDDGRRATPGGPHNKLAPSEAAFLLETTLLPEYCDQSPRQIVPNLADAGRYIASEATWYRYQHANDLQHHRAATRPPSPRPRALTANGPDQVYTWDITYLPSRVRGQFFYLYMIVDIWSRRIIAAIVHERECGELAAAMVENACMSSTGSDNITWLHSDNGAPMKSVTLLATLQRLGISPSFSRPRVSNDNPYSESLFRTLKYRPSYPSRPFANLNAATTWVERFVHWYNTQHLHSAIRFVTPDDRHARRDIPILAKRRSVYAAARARHPERWTGPTRNWEPVLAVCLNPERSSRPSQSMASRD